MAANPSITPTQSVALPGSRGIKARLAVYFNRHMLGLLLLGFASGLPLALVGGTLQAWFKTSGASLVTLGFLTLISQPYSYKFLWAPFFDTRRAPWLSQRKGWILCLQLILMMLLLAMGATPPGVTAVHFSGFSVAPGTFFYPLFDLLSISHWHLPAIEIPRLALLGFALAFCSASQDIVIEAHRAESLSTDFKGLGAALGVEGYRLGMIASGGLALLIADHYGWQAAYSLMAGLMLLGCLGTLLVNDSLFAPPSAEQPKMRHTIKVALTGLLQQPRAWHFLALIVCYKLGDAFAHALTTAFLLDMNFSLSEVGMLNKLVGLSASLLGVFFGGVLMTKIGLYRSLVCFGSLQGITNLVYMVMATTGKNLYLASLGFFGESLCGGMGTAAFVALLMSLCQVGYTATQFAVLTSLAALGRVYVGPFAGMLVEQLGWAQFYIITAVIALPGIALIIYLKPQINGLNTEPATAS